MIDPITGTAIFQGIKTVGGFLNSLINKPKSFGKTAYAKRLKQLMKEGSITGTEKSSIIGNVSRLAGNVASKAKSGFAGRLAAQGMGGSIAGEEKLADIETKAINEIGSTERAIDVENAIAKKRARDEYAAAKSQYGEANQQYKNKAVGNLIGGLADTATGYVVGKYKQGIEEQNRQLEQSQWAAEHGLKIEELNQKERDSVRDFMARMAGVDARSMQNPNLVNVIGGFLKNKIGENELAAYVTKEFKDDPETAANILESIANAYNSGIFGKIEGLKGVTSNVPSIRTKASMIRNLE